MSHSDGVKTLPTANVVTLVMRQHEAAVAKQSFYSAAVAHILRDRHFDPLGYDQCNLAICLTTFLAYLYSRSWHAVLAGFVVWFLFESVVFFALPLFSRVIKHHVAAVESRDYEPIFDWLLFIGALALSVYALSSTILGAGIGSTPPSSFPSGAGEVGTLVAVILVSTLSVFPDIYFLSAGLLLTTIWISYALTASDFHLWNALRATLATVYFYAWFKHPIAYSFVYNGFMALAAAALILSLLTGVAL